MDKQIIDSNCGFCAEYYNMDRDNNLLKTIITPKTGLQNRILYETDSFFVIPTIGAFVKGYVLIVSKNHYDCIGKMPEENLLELNRLQAAIKQLISKKYNCGSVGFEHGSISCSTRLGGCINHAHLHIVPCNDTLIESIAQYDMRATEISSFHDLIELGRNDIPYLFFEDLDCKKYIIEGDVIPSQFFRMIIADYYKCVDKWDWRQFFFLENIVETLKDFDKPTRVE